MVSADGQWTDGTATDESCVQCGADLLDRSDYLECERCGNLEYP